MANKRSIKVEDSGFRQKKRHCSKAGVGKNFDSSVSSPGQKSELKKGGPSSGYSNVIDLSDDNEAHNTHPRIIMKPLPPALDRSRFPRFVEGAVYIIIHPQNRNYQYKFHKALLSGVSAPLKGLLSCKKEELDDILRASSTNAEVRLELIYSPKRTDWMLAKTAFTDFKTNAPWSDAKESNTIPIKAPSSGSGADAGPVNFQYSPCGSEQAVVGQSNKPRPGCFTSSIFSVSVENVDIVSSNKNAHTIDNFSKGQDAAVEEQAPSMPNQPTQNYSPSTDSPIVENDPASNSGTSTTNTSQASEIIENNPILVKQELDISKQQLHTIEQESNFSEQQSIVNESINKQKDIKTCTEDTTMTFNDGDGYREPDMTNVSMVENSVDQSDEDCDTKQVSQDNFSDQNGATNISNQTDGVIHNSEDHQTTRVSEGSQLEVGDTSNENQSIRASQTNEGIKVHEIDHTNSGENIDETLGAKSVLSNKLPVGEAESVELIQINIPTEPPAELCEAYNNLFSIFYRMQPIISKICVSTALQQCEAILALAIRLGSVSTVRPYLGAAICQFGKDLYLSVMAEPFRWLKLSVYLHNVSIFREAVIHIAGACNRVPNGLDDDSYIPIDIPTSLRRLIMRKISQLELWKLQVNETLFMSTIRIGEDLVNLSPQSTSTFPTWLVVQVWRNWFCSKLIQYQDQPQQMGILYRMLSKGGDSYLPLEEFQEILNALKQSCDIKLLEADLEIMKHAAKEITKELCENKSILNVDEVPGLNYLTSTWVDSEELPWNFAGNGE